ncbi:MAG: hypothetical protein Q4A54_07760 [Parabacteroides sp.]|nr:hypothetical protein [Parabacteroides sp.]
MLKINKFLVVSVLTFMLMPLMAQNNNTNSPYTRFGYGDLGDRSFGAGRAMGGVGYGLRSPKQINPMNPASYSCMDSLTFLFDFGVAGQLSWFDDGVNRQHDLNGNVEYIAMQFPVHRRIALSFGLLPYSHVGYEFGTFRDSEGVNFTEAYNGTGSISDVYGGISIDLWPKRLAVGANFGFLFGNISHEQVVMMSSTTESTGAFNTIRSQEFRVRDLKMDFGVQYTHPISKTESITLGLVFSPKKTLNSESYQYTQAYTSSGSDSQVIQADTIKGKTFELPNTYGVGLSYVKQNKLTVAADFSYEDWGKMLYFGEKGHFNNRYRVALGGEFIPNHMRKLYFNRIRYRAGIHYGNSYLRMNQTEANPAGNSYDEIGVSVGFGFPLIDNRSLVNVSFEYLKKKPEVKTNMIEEDYFRFTVNYTFNEFWFFKRKVD